MVMGHPKRAHGDGPSHLPLYVMGHRSTTPIVRNGPPRYVRRGSCRFEHVSTRATAQFRANVST